jgi:hypothetical protein
MRYVGLSGNINCFNLQESNYAEFTLQVIKMYAIQIFYYPISNFGLF